jgi:hypothetical protein
MYTPDPASDRHVRSGQSNRSANTAITGQNRAFTPCWRPWTGRILGVHDWPGLGVHRGASSAVPTPPSPVTVPGLPYPVAGFRSPDSRLPAAGCRIPITATGLRIPVTEHRIRSTGYGLRSPVSTHRLPVTDPRPCFKPPPRQARSRSTVESVRVREEVGGLCMQSTA